MIIHKDFLDEAPESPVHITIKEPQIAAVLVQAGILRNDSCVNYADISSQLFWNVSCNMLNISSAGRKTEGKVTKQRSKKLKQLKK